MVKEVFDRSAALSGLLLLAPLLLVLGFAVWCHDHHSPFYLGRRVGRHGSQFRILKIRSMVADADRLGSSYTTADDSRIIPIGRFIRRWKIDEISQLLNVLRGDMSLVGPRPQVFEEVTTFTPQEQELLALKPGITDFASIVFADEGEILRGAPDPGLAYRQLIRPWKSRLGLFYVAHHSFSVDLQLILLTLVRILAPDRALDGVGRLLQRLGATAERVRVARRRTPMAPHAVPGMSEPFGS